MQEIIVIQDIVVILLVSLPIIFLFKKINIPSIVGFLIAGMIIGPYGFRLINDSDSINALAQMGVITLLFTIGLEISFKDLARMKRFVFIAGTLQVVLTVIISALISMALGLSTTLSIFIGMLISVSSTSIILTLLTQSNELDTPHGQIALSVSIFQDLAVVAMVLSLPLLSGRDDFEITSIFLQLLFAFGAVGMIYIAAKFLIPYVMIHLARARTREVFTIGTILILLGTAYLTYSVGLSFALGAFIAGLILSESDYSSQIVSEILPFKDVFISLFFVSIGLLLNIQLVLAYPLLIILISIGIILLKAAIVFFIVLLIRYPIRIAVMSSLMLAQIGEFAFVLAQAGNSEGIITEEYYNAFLASSIFTMILIPIIFKLAPVLGYESSKLAPHRRNTVDEKEKFSGHVVVAGYGLNGKNLTRVLKETGIKYIVVEMNPDTVREEKQKGEKIIFGDISKLEILEDVCINRANVLVFAISDPGTTRRSLSLAKQLNPNIYTVVRTRYVNEIDELAKLGADAIIPEEFETSLEIFRKVLEKYHIPLNIIMKQVAIIRNESYKLLRKDEKEPTSFIHLDEILAAGLTETYFVNDDNPYIGKELTEINLRAETDATIIAIVRNGNNITNPSGKEKLLARDTLVITGTHVSVDKAIMYLNGELED
ncbi:MAG TPA: cation:proton antiporter [Ignavibacteriaceae bacterium]|nr:cation:proton antiporter [Ignavibacteriaceae bacterium]